MTDKRLPDGAWRPDGVSGADEPKLAIGQWYWVSTRSARGEIERDLWCLTSIGSNYAGFTMMATDHRGQYVTRVHFDRMAEDCTWEPNPDPILDAGAKRAQDRVRESFDPKPDAC